MDVATPLPRNRAAFSLAEIVLATGGEALAGSPADDVVGVSTDSRSVSPGELFVPIVGARFDGHDHVAAAAKAGASAVLLSREVTLPGGIHAVKVPDTMRALGDLARAHRRRWAGHGGKQVVAITGSAGKTTTRHVTAAVLTALGRRVHASTGNLNNAIGVPHVLFGLDANHDTAVIEVGMSTPGEIAHCAAVVEPDAAVVTLVADAHTEGVGSIWGVAREKSELFAHLRSSGVAVANADDAGARAGLVRAPGARHVLYGEAPGADVRLISRKPLGAAGAELGIELRRPDGTRVALHVPVPLLGAAGTYAALAALAVAVGLDPSVVDRAADLARGLAGAGAGEGGRLSPRATADGTLVIDDAYNANPASMVASVRAAREIADAEGRRLVLVLGVMRELGARSDELHASVGLAAARTKPAMVVVVSPDAEPLARAAEGAGAEVHRFPDAAAAAHAVPAMVQPRDVVLIKASNSLGLSAVASKLADKT